MQIFDTRTVSLSPDERSECADLDSAQLLTVLEGSTWVRGRERIWTPLLPGRYAYWADGERQELWSPAGVRASIVAGSAAESLYAYLNQQTPSPAEDGADRVRTRGSRRGRSAVRILCANDAGKVLLWRWPERVSGGFGWLPVGGGIEPEEEPLDAARREWVEETGLDPDAVTEHHVFVRRDLWWEGARHIEDEAFFLARVRGEPHPKPTEMLASECRWTPIDEIGLITEQCEPPEFTQILTDLLAMADARHTIAG